jgi:putative ABC transport system permease protein
MRFATIADLRLIARLASRNIWRHKARTAMTLGAIAFGVAAMILSGGFVQDIYVQLGEATIHSQSGHIQVAKAGYFGSGSRSPEKYLINPVEEARSLVSGHAEVLDVMARLSLTGLLSNGRADVPIIGEGVEPNKETALGTFLRIVEGRALEDADRDGALLGYGVAKALNLRPGDTATVVTSTGGGAMNTAEVRVAGIFQSFSRDYDARAVRIPLPVAQELLDSKGANVLVLSLHRTSSTEPVAARLRGQVAPAGLEAKTWQELNDFYPKTVELYERQFGVLQLIIFAMVLLSVMNTVNMSVFERLGEFGTMRALGNRGRGVFLLVVAENALLGIAGALVGAFIGIMLAALISSIGIPMPPPPNADVGYTARVRVVPSVVAMAFLIGVLATILASILPAARVARGSVVDALRQNV